MKFFRLYALPWLCILLLGISYGVGMLYFYDSSKYQKIFKTISLGFGIFDEKKAEYKEIEQDKVESTPSRYLVLANILNVRSEPNVDSKIIKRLYKGESILINQIEKSWGSLVDKDLNTLGYVFLNPTNAIRMDFKSSAQTYFVNINTLNIRKNPSINSSVIKKIYFGQVVWLLEDLGNGWGRIELDGLHGYVSLQWLKKME